MNANTQNTPPKERDAARERLRQSVDGLTERTNLYAQMQKDPMKVIGSASGAGLLLGLLIGSRVKRTRKIYVDATSNPKDQKAFAKAQLKVAKGGRGSIGGALGGAVLTIAIRVLQDRVLRPQLERMADQFNEKAAQKTSGGSAKVEIREVRGTSTVAPGEGASGRS